MLKNTQKHQMIRIFTKTRIRIRYVSPNFEFVKFILIKEKIKMKSFSGSETDASSDTSEDAHENGF